MLYQPGTDGAAVTDVRLHGSRPSAPRIAKHQNALDPGFHCVRTHWIWGFMTFRLAWRARAGPTATIYCGPP